MQDRLGLGEREFFKESFLVIVQGVWFPEVLVVLNQFYSVEGTEQVPNSVKSQSGLDFGPTIQQTGDHAQGDMRFHAFVFAQEDGLNIQGVFEALPGAFHPHQAFISQGHLGGRELRVAGLKDESPVAGAFGGDFFPGQNQGPFIVAFHPAAKELVFKDFSFSRLVIPRGLDFGQLFVEPLQGPAAHLDVPFGAQRRITYHQRPALVDQLFDL